MSAERMIFLTLEFFRSESPQLIRVGYAAGETDSEKINTDLRKSSVCRAVAHVLVSYVLAARRGGLFKYEGSPISGSFALAIGQALYKSESVMYKIFPDEPRSIFLDWRNQDGANTHQKISFSINHVVLPYQHIEVKWQEDERPTGTITEIKDLERLEKLLSEQESVVPKSRVANTGSEDKKQQTTGGDIAPELQGSWWGYHWTRHENDFPMFIVSTWDIRGDTFTSTHERRHTEDTQPIVDSSRPEDGKLQYRGKIYPEGDRLVFVGDALNNKIQEKAVWRFATSPRRHKETFAEWFGIDYGKRTIAGHVLLSQTELSVEEAMKRITTCKSFFSTPPNITMLDSWDHGMVRLAVKASKPGEAICAFSTYFPEGLELMKWIRSRGEKLKAEFPGLKSLPVSKQISVVVLFLDPRLNETVRVRTHLRDLSANKLTSEIRDQSAALLELKKQYRGFLNVTVGMYCGWPLGTFYQIGNRFMCFGLMMAHESSINGPMFVLNDPSCDSWETLMTDFKLLIMSSVKLTNVKSLKELRLKPPDNHTPLWAVSDVAGLSLNEIVSKMS